jgi:hypothetical protein
MAELTIPSEYRQGFAELLRLVKKDRAQELLSALREVRPVRSRAALRDDLGSKVEGIEPSALAEIVDTLISLFTVRDSLNMPTLELAATMADAVDRSEFDDLALPDKESRESFQAVLAQILGIEPLEVAAKAIVLVYEQDHIVHGTPRVLTDVRPIFNSDATDLSIRAAMVTYTVKFEYHEGRDVKEMFVSLDAEQVEGLIEALGRAQSKAKNLEQWIRGSNFSYLEDE